MTYHSQPNTKAARVSFPRTQAWVEARIADTEADRVQGLHGVRALAPNEGLLFHFPPQPPPIAMTMAEMLIPIDIIFIGNSGRLLTILHIAHRLAPGRQRPVLGPAVPWVLEVPANFARRHQLRLGDTVSLA